MPEMSTQEGERIAIETAIWLEALLFGGSAEELIKMSLTGRVRLVGTEVQITRLLEVLRDRLGFSEAALREVRGFVEDQVEIVTPGPQPAAGVLEPLPPILQAARHGSVTAIATTGRSSLLSLESFEGIPIVSMA